MHLPESLLSQLLTLLVIALALGTDAFSVGLGMGMQRLRWRQIFSVSMVVGMFHVIMPLIGVELGEHLYESVGGVTGILGALVLEGLGARMVYNSFKKRQPGRADARDESNNLQTTGFGLIIYAISVSVDSLSAGFSLGVFEIDAEMAAVIFGAVGALMSAAGLALGRKVGGHLGDYGEAIGGVVLVVIGFQWLR